MNSQNSSVPFRTGVRTGHNPRTSALNITMTQIDRTQANETQNTYKLVTSLVKLLSPNQDKFWI
ncbi:MAG: hypothetical protein ACHBN1_18455 [Heteroscytonema crispum UTEX LB 1556]